MAAPLIQRCDLPERLPAPAASPRLTLDATAASPAVLDPLQCLQPSRGQHRAFVLPDTRRDLTTRPEAR